MLQNFYRVQQQGFRGQGGELAPHQLLSWLQEKTIGEDLKEKENTKLPANSLRGGGGQQDLPWEELEAMRRKTVAEATFCQIIICHHRVCHFLLLASG